MSIKYICYPNSLLPIELIDMIRNDYSIINITIYLNKIFDINIELTIIFRNKINNMEHYITPSEIKKFSTYYNNVIYMPIIPFLSLDEFDIYKSNNVVLKIEYNNILNPVNYIEIEIKQINKLYIISNDKICKNNIINYGKTQITTDTQTLNLNYIINYISNILNIKYETSLEYFHLHFLKFSNFICISYLNNLNKRDLYVLEEYY